MSSRNLECQMCHYLARSRRQLICHILRKHKHDGNFIAYCTIGMCMYSSTSASGYRSHLLRKHPQVKQKDIDFFHRQESRSSESESDDADRVMNPDEYDMVSLPNDEQEHKKSFIMQMAKFLLSLETEHRITKTAIDSIAVGSSELLASVLTICTDEFKQYMIQNGETDEAASEIVQNIAAKVDTEILNSSARFVTSYQRDVVYKHLCRMVVPQEVQLGKRWRKINNRIQNVCVYGYCIPIKKQLECLLSLPEIWSWFKHRPTNASFIMKDVKDGQYIKNHDLNNDPGNFLQLALSYDDIEIQNPLRSNHKYKLGMIYFSILNIPVQFRSKLRNIFLLAIARSKDLKSFGFDAILSDFTYNVNKMATDGIDMTINGQNVLVKGSLIFAVCDTPAAGLLGGFKEGAGFADKPCRKCLGSKDQIKGNFKPEAFPMRTKEEYIRQAEQITDRTKSRAEKTLYSKMYGINNKSPLCSIGDFDVTQNMVMDNMHILSEGLTCHFLALFLHKFIIELQVFDLDWLNMQIEQFPYNADERSHKPEVIARHQIVTDFYIKQKAVAMNTLVNTLPYILGPLFEQHEHENYKHFIMLVQIHQLAFAPYCSNDTAVELEILVEKFATQWSVLYPASAIRPKLHYLTHLARDMRNFGPLHGVSCLRYESKHFFFKMLTTIRNYKNLPFSFSNKHQLFLCNHMIDVYGNPCPNFVYSGDVIGEGIEMQVTRDTPDIYGIFQTVFGRQDEFDVYLTKMLTIHGITYTPESVLLVSWPEYEFPKFGIIENIYIRDDVKYFLVKMLETQTYLYHYHSYLVQMSRELKLIKWDYLKNKFTLNLRKQGNRLMVMNKYGEFSGSYYQ